MIPQKDDDGKFPCPHCNKTYLHAKHLKRHLLRHTGDRPYMCHLCTDTFSRSDILKRHFLKCSLRRGNPTGANHLAHQRGRASSVHRLSASNEEGPIGLAALREVACPQGHGVNADSTGDGHVSARPSRTNSGIAMGSRDHRSISAGLGILGPNAQEHPGSTSGFQQGMPACSGQNTGGTMPSYALHHPAPTESPFGHHDPQLPMPFLGQSSARFAHSPHSSNHHTSRRDDASDPQLEWTRVYEQDGYFESPTNVSSQALEPDTKPDRGTMSGNAVPGTLLNMYPPLNSYGGEYGDAAGSGILGFPNWSSNDPLQAKVDRLMTFCFPNGVNETHDRHAVDLVETFLTTDNVRHLMEQFTSFHGHFPVLHTPTFDVMRAHNGLVMAVLCIGAVYSDRFRVEQTRAMMDFVQARVFGASSVYSRMKSNQLDDLGTVSWELDELQALVMLVAVLMWHGEPRQCRKARDEFPTIVRLAHTMGLLQPCPPGHYAYSALHSTVQVYHPQEAIHWNWHSWVQQEKRNRAIYWILIIELAMSALFNFELQFTFDSWMVPEGMDLLLPADDAAWDAKDAQACADALGLNGPQAQSENQTGTKLLQQPSVREAMFMLLEPSAPFQPGTTNAFSKFILIQGVMAKIMLCQKALLVPNPGSRPRPSTLDEAAPVTPVSQNDSPEGSGENGPGSASTSGQTTPAGQVPSDSHQTSLLRQERERLFQVLDKFKVCLSIHT